MVEALQSGEEGEGPVVVVGRRGESGAYGFPEGGTPTAPAPSPLDRPRGFATLRGAAGEGRLLWAVEACGPSRHVDGGITEEEEGGGGGRHPVRGGERGERDALPSPIAGVEAAALVGWERRPDRGGTIVLVRPAPSASASSTAMADERWGVDVLLLPQDVSAKGTPSPSSRAVSGPQASGGRSGEVAQRRGYANALPSIALSHASFSFSSASLSPSPLPAFEGHSRVWSSLGALPPVVCCGAA